MTRATTIAATGHLPRPLADIVSAYAHLTDADAVILLLNPGPVEFIANLMGVRHIHVTYAILGDSIVETCQPNVSGPTIYPDIPDMLSHYMRERTDIWEERCGPGIEKQLADAVRDVQSREG